MKQILVIDDDAGILDALEAFLESEEYSVITSSNSDYINKLNPENLPDIILLDVLLSGEDGRDVCRKIKSQTKTMYIPIVMMSAAPDMEASVKKAKADDFLKKPFDIEEVLDTIEKYIG